MANCNLLSVPVLEGHHSQYKFYKAKGIYQHAPAAQDLAACCSFPQESLWSHHHHCSPGHPMSNIRALPFPRCTFCMASGIKQRCSMFSGLCSLWRMLWLRHNMILQAAFNDTPGLCRDRCGISNPQHIQAEWANRVRPSHCLPV